MKKLIVAPMIALTLAVSPIAFTGCQNAGEIIQQVLKSPDNVQADIQALGVIAKPYLDDATKAKIHQAAVTLQTTANLDLSAIYALFPSSTGSFKGDLLLSAVKTTLSLVYTQVGAHNPTTIAYLHAVANGLLANF